MGVDRPIDVTADQRKTLLALIKRHLPNTTAWAYGSRVKWTARPQSDLDLVVFTKPEQERNVSELREAFEESNLPFRVDLFVWDAVPEPFRKQIEAEHAVLVEREVGSFEKILLGAPGNWTEATIDDIIASSRNAIVGGPFGSNLVSRDYVPEGVPVIRGQNMGNRWVAGDFVFVTQQKAKSLEANLARPGDIVLTQRGTLGQVSLVPLAPFDRYLVSQSQMKITVNREIADPLFFYYVLSSVEQQDYVRQNAIQTGVPHTNLGILRSTPVPVPSLDEQRAIAHILGTLDDKIELNRRMNETLEAMARALFKSWFIDFDPVRAKAALRNHSPLEGESARQGRSPQARRWGDEKGSKAASLLGRGHPPPHQPSPVGSASATPPQGGSDWSVERARAYLDNMDEEIAALFPDRLVDSELGPIPEGWEVKRLGALIELAYGKALKSDERKNGSIPVYGSNGQVGWHDERLVAGPGIVVGRKGNPGVVTWAHSDFFPIDTAFYVVPTNTNHSLPFLFFALTAQDLASVSADSAVPGLNRNLAYMNSQLVPDNMVINEFSNCANTIFACRYSLEEESRTLAAMRDTLLPKLISGKIRIPKVEKLAGTAV